MKIAVRLSLVVLAAAAWLAPGSDFDPLELVRSLDPRAMDRLWPGFDPSRLPIALFDGSRTWLLHHPAPPPEFARDPGRDGVFVMDGQHPSVVAYSTVEMGGVRTATFVRLPGASAANTRWGIVHEMFHVFWMSRHPNVRPNEMARYAYPVTDERVLNLCLAEEEALARALEAGSPAETAGWAAAALRFRRERRPLLPDRHVSAFETGLEQLEGTATSVADTMAGERPEETSRKLRRDWPADQVRERFYHTGAAVCLLLDRLRPGWKAESDADQELTIEHLLDETVTRMTAIAAELPAEDRTRIANRASAAAAELTGRRKRVRDDLLGRDAAKIVIEAPAGAERFRLARFHPLFLMVLDSCRVAHESYLTLSLGAGSVEVANPSFARDSFAGTVALTEGGGAQPLMNIRKVTVVGVRGVKVDRSGGRVVIAADGVKVSFAGATLRVEGETYRVSWTAAAK
jgi:hypothetical protein